MSLTQGHLINRPSQGGLCSVADGLRNEHVLYTVTVSDYLPPLPPLNFVDLGLDYLLYLCVPSRFTIASRSQRIALYLLSSHSGFCAVR